MDDTERNGCDYGPIKLYLYTVTFEFHTIFMSHEAFFSYWCFYQPFKDVQTIFSSKYSHNGCLGLQHMNLGRQRVVGWGQHHKHQSITTQQTGGI